MSLSDHWWHRPARPVRDKLRSRVLVAVALFGMVLGSALCTFDRQAMAAAAQPDCTADASDAAAAAAKAHACGRQVEVLGKRSEVSRTFANPSGTMTLEQSTVPVRARDDNGLWAGVNTNLRKLADGSIAPVVSAVKLRLSGGGAGPLVTLMTSRGTVAMSWPGSLPVPSIDGDSAVYEDVLPGVDLRVRAHADGFSHVLVVKTPQAATNPALRSVRYGLSGSGLAIHDVNGQREIVNGSGQLLAQLGDALMWDSTTTAVSSLRSGEARARGTAVGESPLTGDDGVASTPSTPGSGAKTAAPKVSVAPDALVLQPDLALLTNPAATFPIYVDPPFTSPWNIWAYSNSAGNNRPMDEVRVGADPDNGSIFRSFFRFAAWDLQGSVILDARMETTLKHSWTCASSYVAVYGANDPGAYGQVSWSGNPLNGAPLSVRSVHAHKGTNACGDQPDQPVEFGGPGEWLDEYLQGVASGYGSWVTFALSTQQWNWSNGTGYGEGVIDQWKKFTTGVSLSVTYDHYPNAPTPAAMLATDCSSQCSSPAQVHTTQPSLRATVSDPDSGGQLRTTFEVRATPADAGTLVTGNDVAPAVTSNGATAQWQVPAGVLANATYYWRARSSDENGIVGGWSSWQTLTVDTSPPAPATVSSAQYPYRQWGAVAGTDGTFTLTGGSDVVSFTWSIDGGATTVVPATGSGTKTINVSFKPTKDMVHTLRSSTMDAAGNVSANYDHQFWVSPLPNRCWSWQLDETAGTVAADTGNSGAAGTPCASIGSSVTAMPATAGGSVSWSADADRGHVVVFGGSGQLATASAVLNTSQAFTVQAWTKFSSLAGPNAQTVVSQSGTNTSRFELQYRPEVNGGAGGVCFTMRDADVVSASETSACSSVPSANPVVAGDWVHLAGVYDPAAQEIRLYIRGDVENCGGEQAAATATFGSSWIDAGKFYIGRGSGGGDAATHALTGSVDAVYAHQRALDGIEICQMSLQ